MAINPAQLARATVTAGAAVATLHTAATGGSLVKSVVVTNATGTAGAITLSLAGVVLLGGVSVAANSLVVLDVTQRLANAETITASSTGADLQVHVGGAVMS